MFQVNNRRTRSRSGVFIVNFDNIWHVVVVFFFFLYVVFFFAGIERERRMEYFTALIYIYLCIPELDLGE